MRNVNKRYFKHKIENLLHISKLVTIYYFNFGRDFSSIGESHDFWEMVYVDKNEIICERDGETILVKEGEAIFHMPGEYHIHKTAPDTNASVFIISFVCRSAPIGFFNKKTLKLDREHTKYIFMLIEESRKTFDLRSVTYWTKKLPLLEHPTLGGIQVIKNILETLLISIMREGDVDSPNPTFVLKEDFDEYITNQVIEYLAENIHTTVRIDDICHKLNYTKSYLFKQFKSVTGQSIMQYFTSLKVREAKRLLRETELSVTEIAESLAFDTPNYFSKTFKRVAGYTPLEYRRIRRMQNR